MVDLLWTAVGFLVGVVTTAVGMEFAWSRLRNDERIGFHAEWDLRTLGRDADVRVIATQLGVPVPAGSRVVVPPGTAVPGEVANQCDVRVHERARGNVATGTGKGLVLTGPLQRGTLGLMTTHPAVVAQLERAFEGLWIEGRPYVAKLDDGPGDGSMVKVRGKVAEVFRTGAVARVTLETQQGRVTIQVPATLAPRTGEVIEVSGRLRMTATGKYVVAEDIAVPQ